MPRKLVLTLYPFKRDLQKERYLIHNANDLDNVSGLAEQMAKVDAEIDQKVYALYELMEDEIKIIEGN